MISTNDVLGPITYSWGGDVSVLLLSSEDPPTTGSFYPVGKQWCNLQSGSVWTLVNYNEQNEPQWQISGQFGPTRTFYGKISLENGNSFIQLPQINEKSTVFITRQFSSGEPGEISISSISVGSGFTISSTSLLDSSIVGWQVIN